MIAGLLRDADADRERFKMEADAGMVGPAEAADYCARQEARIRVMESAFRTADHMDLSRSIRDDIDRL